MEEEFSSAHGAADPLEGLVEALRRLPGVGVKSAQRMAYHLLQNDREAAQHIAASMQRALAEVRHCERCHTFTTEKLCAICSNPGRDRRLLCVVETPADLAALERSGSYRGLYFVLMGRVSPLDGIGARDLGLRAVVERASDGEVEEVIIATNFTAEGEATSHVLGEMLGSLALKVTRLARGVPAGSELEHVDLSTIAHALVDRR